MPNIILKKMAEIAIYKKICVLLSFISLILRTVYVHTIETVQLYDFKTYNELAINIAKGLGHTLNGEPIAWTPPAYPYALGLYYKLTGVITELNGKYFNIICAAATLTACFFIADKLFSNKKTVMLCYGILCVFPNYIAYTNVLGTEVFFTMLLSIALCINLYFGGNIKADIPTGVVVGILALTKPTMLVYPTVLAGLLWIRKKSIKQSVLYFATVTIVMILTILPWTYNNMKSYDRFIFLTYNMGYNMYVNNNDGNVRGAWMDLANIAKPAEIQEEINNSLRNGERSIKEAYELEPLLKSEAVAWIKANPIEYAKLCVLRFSQTFFNGADDIGQWSLNQFANGESVSSSNLRTANALFALFNIIAMVLNSFGIIFMLFMFPAYCFSFFSKKKSAIDEMVSVTFLHIAFFAVVYLCFEGQSRYSYPVYIFMIMALVKFCENMAIKNTVELA